MDFTEWLPVVYHVPLLSGFPVNGECGKNVFQKGTLALLREKERSGKMKNDKCPLNLAMWSRD